MSRKIVGVTVGTSISPEALKQKLNISSGGVGGGYVVQDTAPEDTSVLWVDPTDNTEDEIPDTGGNVDLTGVVKSVNGVTPDENGNVEIMVSGGATVATVEPEYEDIPKIFFDGALQQTKDEAVVPFRYISKTDDFSGYAEIKAQGNSSMSYPKKNQTVKMFKDADCTEKMKVDFKGWGKQNKHVYKANWIDLTHARNVVSARLWADVVKSRPNYAELPELLRTSPNQGAVDGFPVKVYANGIYQGRYTINIPKDAWMANMDKDLDTHCILCGENYVSGCFRAAANIDESDWTDEIHDVVPASIKTRWNQVISFVMNATDENFKANLGNYFYVDSLIDYYLFGLASCGLDAFGKNQLYMTYDGQKWIATMYDMDSTWGLYWNGSKFVSTSYGRNEYEDYVNSTGNLLYVRLEQLFWSELQARWEELKNGALSIENIINRFERFTDIAPADLVKEDYASTTGGSKFTGIPSQSTNNIQQIRAFALARQAWTDAYVAALTGSGEIDPEEPDLPDVPDEPDEGANILNGVSWHYNTFNGITGAEIIVNTDISTDAIDVSAYAGKRIAYKADVKAGKIGFWDESGAWISGIYTSDFSYDGVVPTNAATMRVATSAEAKEFSLYFGDNENLLDAANENFGMVYSQMDGTQGADSGHSSQKIALAHAGMLATYKIVSGALLGANDAFVSSIPYTAHAKNRYFEVTDGMASAGLNYTKASTSEVYAYLLGDCHTSIIEIT